MSPTLAVTSLRGNLDTRLRKLDDGNYDAIVLAAAGLKRLGLADRIRTSFDPAEMLPAAGQGALGIEVLEDAGPLREQLAGLIHRPTWLAVHAERAVSRTLGGSCSMPLAAHATWHGSTLQLDAALGDGHDTGRPLLRVSLRADAADEEAATRLGEEAAQQLRTLGADGYLATTT